MGNVNLETAAQVVAIPDGVVALIIRVLQAVEAWLDIGEKLKKRGRGRKLGQTCNATRKVR